MANDNLSDVTLEIGTDEVKNICNNWNQQVASIDIESINIDSTFAPLIECGIAPNYLSSLKTALQSIGELVSSVSSAIKSAADEQSQADEAISKKTITNTKSTSGGGGGGYYSSNPSTEQKSSISEIDATKIDPAIQVLDNLSYGDSTELSNLLSSFITKDSSLLSILSNLENAEYIKSILLRANISDVFKKNIEGMDAETLQAAIYYYYTEKCKLSSITKGILTNQLLTYDTSSMISTKELLVSIIKDSNVTNKSIASLLNDNNIGQSIITKYNTTSDKLFKSIIENVAASIDPNSSVDEVFGNSENVSKIKENFETILQDLDVIKVVGYTNATDGEAMFNRLLKA